jgi:hypothetical protein
MHRQRGTLPLFSGEAVLEEQALWKNIAMLTKELRYKLEQYRKEKANEGIF